MYKWDWTEHQPGPEREAWVGSEITALAYSPDGKYLAVGVSGGGTTFWDVRDDLPSKRKRVRTFPRHEGAVLALAFSPDGRTLAIGAADGKVRLHDLWKAFK